MALDYEDRQPLECIPERIPQERFPERGMTYAERLYAAQNAMRWAERCATRFPDVDLTNAIARCKKELEAVNG